MRNVSPACSVNVVPAVSERRSVWISKGAPNSKDRFGYLVVHGVGNQHRRIGSGRSVLHHMGRGIVDPIARLGAVRTQIGAA